MNNDNLKKIINKYCKNELSLFDFETDIINFPVENVSEEIQDILNDIQEDIAYTSKKVITEADKQSGIISEKELKQRLQDYLK